MRGLARCSRPLISCVPLFTSERQIKRKRFRYANILQMDTTAQISFPNLIHVKADVFANSSVTSHPLCSQLVIIAIMMIITVKWSRLMQAKWILFCVPGHAVRALLAPGNHIETDKGFFKLTLLLRL